MKKVLFSIILLGSLAFVIGCETEEDNTIAKAQKCLDKTNAAGASTCLAMVSGLESTESYAIRCAARFLMDGLTTARVADAVESLKTTTAGQDPAAIMMGMFSFQSTTDANLAYADCNKSGSASFIYIGQVARMGTLITSFDPTIAADIAAGNPIDPADVDAAVDAALASGASNADIGETAIAIAASQCSVPGQNTEVCSQINAAIAAGGTNADIGAAILEALQNP